MANFCKSKQEKELLYRGQIGAMPFCMWDQSISSKNQIIILKELKKLSNQLNKKDNFWHYLFKINNSKSLYIYGSVGRGKSMLMNYFFNLLKIEKSYFHFNDFMQKIHKNLHQIRIQNKNKDHILQITINKILKNSKILCLDEFQVYDIVDAMILSDIFKYIFKKKITVIFTSNSYPADLYKDGLQRQYFLQFINNIILKECKILNLDGYQDYRVQNNKSHSNFIYPINKYNLELFFLLFIQIYIFYKMNRYSEYGNDATAHLLFFYLISITLKDKLFDTKEILNLLIISLFVVLNKIILLFLFLLF